MMSIFRDYRDILRGTHRNVRLFFLTSFLYQMGTGFFGILYNLYIKSIGLPDPVAGSYVAASALANTLFLVPAGLLGDRFGRKRMLQISLSLNALVMVLQAFARLPWLIVAGAFLSGMVASVVWVSALPLLAENTAKEDRFHLFSVNFGLGLIAQVLSSVISGSLSQFIAPWLGEVWSLRLPLLVGSVFLCLALAPFVRFEEASKVVQSAVSENRPRMHWKDVVRLRGEHAAGIKLIVQFAVASSIIGFGAGLVIPYLNLYFAERFHMTRATIGIVIGSAQAVTALAMFIGPSVANRLGPVKAAVGFQLASIPFLLTTAYASNAWLASGAVVVRNALMNCASPIQDSIMMALVSEELRGFAVSLGQTLWSLGWAVMGPISTNIVHHFGSYSGYAIVFSGTATLYLVGSTYYYISFRKHEHRVIGESSP